MSSNRYRTRYSRYESMNENDNSIVKNIMVKSIVCILIFILVFSVAKGYGKTSLVMQTYTYKIMNTNTDITTLKDNFTVFWSDFAEGIKNNENKQET